MFGEGVSGVERGCQNSVRESPIGKPEEEPECLALPEGGLTSTPEHFMLLNTSMFKLGLKHILSFSFSDSHTHTQTIFTCAVQ